MNRPITACVTCTVSWVRARARHRSSDRPNAGWVSGASAMALSSRRVPPTDAAGVLVDKIFVALFASKRYRTFMLCRPGRWSF